MAAADGLEWLVNDDGTDTSPDTSPGAAPEPGPVAPVWPASPFGTQGPPPAPRPGPDPYAARPPVVPPGRLATAPVGHVDGGALPDGGVLPDGGGIPMAPPAWTGEQWGRAPRRRRSGRGWLVAGAVLLALVSGTVGGVIGARTAASPQADLPPAATARPDGSELTGVASIAAQVLPSVVLIEVRGADGEGTGSGFVLQSDGYLLTNAHVATAEVGSDRTITVVFADGSHADATLVGVTTDYDLAVLKVDRTGLTPLTLGDSDQVVVGDPVVAIGAPLGLQGTVTTGIVSAMNRPVTAGDTSAPAFINAIQTDAAINPGNSGGPLVNAAGEVIGINSAIAQPPGTSLSGTAGSIGLGFAIPANQARHTAEQLIDTGTATYPIIGVLIDSRYTGEGVQVATEAVDGQEPVVPDGPADRAGIRPGDVILAIDGRPVTQPDELIVAIRAKQAGDTVVLTVRSDGQENEVRVVLSESTSG